MASRKFKKILVVKPSSLGDIIHSLPFLNSVRKCFPDSEIHWVVARGFHDLLESHPMIDKLWIINKDQWKNVSAAGETIRELRTLYKSLKDERYDLVVDLQGLLRSALISRATASAMRVGFSEAREGSSVLYTHKVEGGSGIHAVDRYLKVASFLGCDVSEVAFPMTEAPFPLPFNGDFAVVAPGARWKTKRWPPVRFSRLVLRLPIRSVIVGSKPESLVSKQIAEESGGKAISVAGKTSLKQLSGIIRKARFVVTNDSGPMHMAAAHGVPVFAFFGPTSPANTGPYGVGHTIIAAGEECSPCFKKRCRDIKCMDNIRVSKVLEIISSKMNLG